MAHAVIVNMLKRNDWQKYLAFFLGRVADKDAGIKKVLNVLAASQQIDLVRKDALRKDIRAFFRARYGDRLLFADSRLHLKKR